MTRAEDSAFDDLFRSERGPLLRYLSMRLKSVSDAEEVLQDTFIQFRRVQETTEINNAHAMLVKIASNLAIDRLRQNLSRSNREKAWGDNQYRAGSLEGALGEVSETQLRQLESRREIERVLQLLAALSPQVRRAFMLHKFEGMSHREVAQSMGLSQSTVEKHIMKAVKHLLAGIT
jgi:RNA polymerase sigma-70 factor (ECF subfamily)